MITAFDALSPKDSYCITKADYISDFDQTVVTFLYQPIIGTAAFSLYWVMWSQVKQENEQTFILHSQLLNLLNLDLPHFYEARSKLEATGLLKTYQKMTDNGRQLIYEMYPPLKPNHFFNDDLLSTLLYELVGQNAFEQVQNRFKIARIDTTEFHDVSHDFLSEFSIAPQHLIKAPDAVVAAKNDYQGQKENPVGFSQVQLQQFDWSLLQEISVQYQVKADDILNHQQALFNLAYFYDIDVLTLAQLIGKTLDLSRQAIDIKRLENYVLNRYQRKQKPIMTEQSAKPKVQLSEAQLKKNWQKAGISPAMQQQLLEARPYKPLDYLQMLKQKRNSFVADHEIRALKNLQSRHLFEDDVLNVLIHYLLDRYNNLNQSLLDTVASQWAQEKVTTVLDALKQIEQFTQAKNKPQKYQNKTANKNNEPIPKWAQADYQENAEKQLTDAEKLAFEEKLKKIRERRQV